LRPTIKPINRRKINTCGYGLVSMAFCFVCPSSQACDLLHYGYGTVGVFVLTGMACRRWVPARSRSLHPWTRFHCWSSSIRRVAGSKARGQLRSDDCMWSM